MKRYPEYKALNLTKIAADIQHWWEENKIFEKSVQLREGCPEYVFYEGPPSANGMPGIHHVMARAIKDIFCRYHTQKGEKVFRKAGWDTHGLPIELGVEKELGITKEDIGNKISVEEYNQKCREAVMRFTDVWNDLTRKIGYWVDLQDPYITYEPKYMESVWWLLAQLYKKGLLYKGYTIQPYSPKAGTGLSSHELNQPGTYRDVSDTTIVAQFRVRSFSDTLKHLDAEGPVDILAWTTTPWTLPSNTALTVGNKIEYVLVKTFNQYTFQPCKVILAKVLLEKNFGKKYIESSEEDFKNYTPGEKLIPYQILNSFYGEELIGTTYEQLLPWFTPAENPEQAFRVIPGDFVTTEDGTGVVHTAPTFGADDAKVAREAGIPPMLVKDENGNLVPLVDLTGRFLKGGKVPEIFAGKFIKNEYYTDGKEPDKSWDVELAILLKTEGKAFKVEKYIHSYPHCWRTDKPVLYYPLDSWFVKMTEKRDRLVELNQEINWKPKSTGEGRFANWLENINDWNLSRSRYWGIPLPIWRTADAKEEICIASVEELMAEIEKSKQAGILEVNPYQGFVPGDMSEENYQKIDLHKNIVDKIVLVSPSGKPMYRETDLIDVWFDSGAMPYAQLHYPFENKDLIDNHRAFPADFIAEGVDQTRGWFYTLHAIGTAVFDSVAYKNVVSNGLVLDKNGQKMSKRLNNAIDPFSTLEKYGPDATRWYMISNANPWENLRFDLEGIDEVRRKFFGTLYNTYSFFALYANMDGFTYKEEEVKNRPEIDRWILSELHLLIKEVTQNYEAYEPTRVARAITSFVNDNLSNWYVRLCRRRFWKGEYTEDKVSAFQTLYTCLENIARLSAPIAPFFMDRLYQDLNGLTQKNEAISVHHTDFPVFDPSKVDQDLVEKTQLAQRITSMVFSLRKKENIKVRQPLQKIIIPVLNDKTLQQLQDIKDLIAAEVNVKTVELISPEQASEMIVKQIKPNFKTLGPKLGKDMKTIATAIENLDQKDIQALESNGELSINGYTITKEDTEIFTKDIPGWTVATEAGQLVALDINLNPDLIAEGIAREFINRIQNLRKEREYDLADPIALSIKDDTTHLNALLLNKDYIQSEVQAIQWNILTQLDNPHLIEIDGNNIAVQIQKI